MSNSTLKCLYRVAVISDIHAHSEKMDVTSGKEIPSWVSQAISSTARHKNPLVDLHAYIKQHGITADLLLCPGDIADKANEAALDYAWKELQSIATTMKVTQVIGAVGNHDLHSRPTPALSSPPTSSSIDTPGIPLGIATPAATPNAKIRELNPTYPVTDPEEFRRYWSDQIASYFDDYCRVVTLNSCAAHGYISEGTEEYKRGRFTEEAEQRLLDLVASTDVHAVNILLTHHHPQQITDLQFSDTSAMLRGDRLLKLLGSGDYGSWIVVHGHRHVPFFTLGPGDNDRPYVFSAGSVGVILHPLFYPTRPQNQFYILEFDLVEIERRGTGLFGFLNAWNWHLGKGWQFAGDSDTIPARSGFGSRTPVSSLARQVAEFIRAKAANHSGPVGVFEEEVTRACPDIAFLMPTERERFRGQLEKEGISVGTHPRQRSKLLFVYTNDAPLQQGFRV